MVRAATRKWHHRAGRVVNMRRQGAEPPAEMLTWYRQHKFNRALAYVSSLPLKAGKASILSPLKILQAFFNRRVASRFAEAA